MRAHGLPHAGQRQEFPHEPDIFVSYTFSGEWQTVWTTLVVRLWYSQEFAHRELWRNAAEFESARKQTLGLKITKTGDGAATISLYFDAKVEDVLKVIFIEYVHRQNPARDGIALQPLLDEVDERHLLVALLAGDEVLLRFEPPAHRVEILHALAALRAHIAPVARHLAGILREVAVDILDKDDLQLVGHLQVEVEADRRGTVARLRDLQSQRLLPGRLELRRIAPQLPVREFMAIPQAHHQSRPHSLPLAAEGVGDEDVRLMRDVLLPAVTHRNSPTRPYRNTDSGQPMSNSSSIAGR